MTFEDWLANHRDEIVGEPSGGQEIQSLLAVIDRDLADARGPISLDGRFVHIFHACLTVARTALRASGYRTRSKAHHQRSIDSLRYTLGLDPGSIRELQAYRIKRANAEYEMVGLVTETELEEALLLAEDLKNKLLEWLRQGHPELMP
jgi:hypothetical protein